MLFCFVCVCVLKLFQEKLGRELSFCYGGQLQLGNVANVELDNVDVELSSKSEGHFLYMGTRTAGGRDSCGGRFWRRAPCIAGRPFGRLGAGLPACLRL
jgi:hypothetical protein